MPDWCNKKIAQRKKPAISQYDHYEWAYKWDINYQCFCNSHYSLFPGMTSADLAICKFQ